MTDNKILTDADRVDILRILNADKVEAIHILQRALGEIARRSTRYAPIAHDALKAANEWIEHGGKRRD